MSAAFGLHLLAGPSSSTDDSEFFPLQPSNSPTTNGGLLDEVQGPFGGLLGLMILKPVLVLMTM